MDTDSDSDTESVAGRPVTSAQLSKIYPKLVTEESLTDGDMLKILGLLSEEPLAKRVELLAMSPYREMWKLWAIVSYPTARERFEETKRILEAKLKTFNAIEGFPANLANRLSAVKPEHAPTSSAAGPSSIGGASTAIEPLALKDVMIAVFANDIPQLKGLTAANEVFKAIIAEGIIESIEHDDPKSLIAHRALVMVAHVILHYGLYDVKGQFDLALSLLVEMSKSARNHSVLSTCVVELVNSLREAHTDSSHSKDPNNIIAVVSWKIFKTDPEFDVLLYKTCLTMVWNSQTEVLNDMLALSMTAFDKPETSGQHQNRVRKRY